MLMHTLHDSAGNAIRQRLHHTKPRHVATCARLRQAQPERPLPPTAPTAEVFSRGHRALRGGLSCLRPGDPPPQQHSKGGPILCPRFRGHRIGHFYTPLPRPRGPRGRGRGLGEGPRAERSNARAGERCGDGVPRRCEPSPRPVYGWPLSPASLCAKRRICVGILPRISLIG